MVCRWIRDGDVPGGKYHLPDCIGAAVYGPRGCTCSKQRERRDLETKIKELERRIEKLEIAK